MPLDLANYEMLTREAVMAFWGQRDMAAKKQQKAGVKDQGTRGAVTGGKNMDGFVALMQAIVKANGLSHAKIAIKKSAQTLPGYFRPTKDWDMLVLNEGKLIAVLEFKSQVGSFGNNFNNRTEEAIGSAHDFWTAYREGAFGKDVPLPFMGWLMLVEDCDKSQTPVRVTSTHFDAFEDFEGASYAQRYEILCRKLVQEKLYTAACLMTSPQEAVNTGAYKCLSQTTSIETFAKTFAAHVAKS